MEAAVYSLETFVIKIFSSLLLFTQFCHIAVKPETYTSSCIGLWLNKQFLTPGINCINLNQLRTISAQICDKTVTLSVGGTAC